MSIRASLFLALLLPLFGCEKHVSPAVDTSSARPFRFPPPGSVVRAVYTVVDEDGVYVGSHRVAFDLAVPFVEETAAREGITIVFVLVTDLAKYGDLVRFYTGIDRERFDVTSFPVRSVPIGSRMPAVGVFKRTGASWFDEANRRELL